jgi:mannose-1-phosphate guanylyltransferase
MNGQESATGETKPSPQPLSSDVLPRKAFLLAGGLGQRLRPLTDVMPKCLVPIDGTPLLAIWLDRLAEAGVASVLVNVSRFPEQVEALVSARTGSPSVRVVREAEPLGSAGTVLANADWVGGEASFWVIYADNLSTVDLRAMAAFHASHDDVLTLGLFRAPQPQAAGIVTLNRAGVVTSFEEKPQHPRSDLAFAGLMIARSTLLADLPRRPGLLDFGHHVLPALIGRMRGHEIREFLLDVGTPEALDRANAVWASLPRDRHP